MKILLYSIVLPGLMAASSEIGLRAHLSRINEDRKFVNDIADCTGIVIKQLFSPDNDIAIVGSTYIDSDIVTNILYNTFAEKIVYIYRSLAELNDETYMRREMSTIVLEKRANLLKIMKDPEVERWAEYVIVTIASPKWLKAFSHILWSYGFSKVAFIGIHPNRKYTVFSLRQKSIGAMPYLKSFDICDRLLASNASTESKISDDQELKELYSFSSWKYIAKNDSFKYASLNYHSTLQHPNEDANNRFKNGGTDFLKIFAEKHNFTLLKSEWKKDIVPSWSKLVERCVKNEFDVFYTLSLDGRSIDNSDVEALDWFRFQSIVMVEKTKNLTLPIASLFAPFSNVTWYCNIGLTFIFFLFFSAMEVLWRRRLVRERVTLLDLWSIFCNVGAYSVPTKFGLRFVFGMWLLRTIIVNGSYMGQFSTSLINIDTFHGLNTFEDIRNTGQMVCGYESTQKFVNDSEDPFLHDLAKRFKVIDTDQVRDAIFNESCIVAQRRSVAERFNWMNLEDPAQHLHIIDNAVLITYPVFFFVKKRHPFIDEFKKTLWSMKHAGLLHALDGNIYGKMIKDFSFTTFVPPDKQGLHMKHLMPAFQLLFVGLFISTIVFIIEIIVYKRSVKKIAARNL